MARTESCHEQAKIRKNRRKEANDTNKGALRGVPRYSGISIHLILELTEPVVFFYVLRGIQHISQLCPQA